jgi:hypothetical protein
LRILSDSAQLIIASFIEVYYKKHIERLGKHSSKLKEKALREFLIYPKAPPKFGSVLLSSYELFSHVNEIPKSRVADTLNMTERMFGDFDGRNDDVRRTLATQLADVPDEDSMLATENRKGSVLGIVSLTCALHDPKSGDAVKQAVKTGRSIIIHRLSGPLYRLTSTIEIFPDFSEMKRHVEGLPDA